MYQVLLSARWLVGLWFQLGSVWVAKEVVGHNYHRQVGQAAQFQRTAKTLNSQDESGERST